MLRVRIDNDQTPVIANALTAQITNANVQTFIAETRHMPCCCCRDNADAAVMRW